MAGMVWEGERVFKQVPINYISRQRREWQKGPRITKISIVGRWLDLMV